MILALNHQQQLNGNSICYYLNMMKLKSLYILVFVMFMGFSYGQSKGSFQKQYLQAKSLFNKGQYAAAVDAFKALTVKNKNNNFDAYAHYYCGLSAYRAKKYLDARFILVKALDTYPKWDKIEEVNYLLAITCLEEGKLDKSLTYAIQLSDEETVKNYDAELSQKLSDTTSLVTLRKVQRLLPCSESVARRLYNKLDEQQSLQSEFEMHYFAQEFNFFGNTGAAIDEPTELISIKKDIYDVAIVLPFKATLHAKKKSPYYELYLGIKIAVDSINRNGEKIRLHVYDSEGDITRVQAFIQKGLFDNIDLFVGPVSIGEASVISDFALSNHVHYINPLSHNVALIDNNPYTFLYMASFRKQAEKLADFSKSAFDKRDIAIFYGADKQDSIVAQIYKDYYEGINGKTVKVFKRITSSNAKEITADVHRLKYGGDPSHIFVASEDPLIGSYVVTALEKERAKIPVLAPYKWLEIQTNSYEQYILHNVHFYKDYFVDLNGDAKVMAFRNTIENQLGVKPRKEYAHVGYDLMLLFGNSLIENGRLFGENLVKGKYQAGETLQGIDFTDENSNDVFPILKFDEERKLIWLNQPK